MARFRVYVVIGLPASGIFDVTAVGSIVFVLHEWFGLVWCGADVDAMSRNGSQRTFMSTIRQRNINKSMCEHTNQSDPLGLDMCDAVRCDATFESSCLWLSVGVSLCVGS